MELAMKQQSHRDMVPERGDRSANRVNSQGPSERGSFVRACRMNSPNTQTNNTSHNHNHNHNHQRQQSRNREE